MTRLDAQQITVALAWIVDALEAMPWDADPEAVAVQKAMLRAIQVKTLNEWWRNS